MSTSKHRLRRSCAFCRARKIKCSNEAICEACRRQGADCIYDFETTRSKTRNSSQDRGSAVPGTPSASRLSIGASSSSSSITGSLESDFDQVGPGSTFGETEDVAATLERTFFDHFPPQHQQPFRSQPRPLTSPPSSGPSRDSPLPQLRASTNLTCTGLLTLITQDLLGLVADQFSSLGCSHVDAGHARFFLTSLSNDETHTMFDEYDTAMDSSAHSSPLTELGQRQQTQLIDVWYSSHPLSFTVSKTLLLRELRDGTLDEGLLSIILGEASIRTGNESRGRSLILWAASQLRSRPLRGSHLTQNGSVSLDDSTPTLSSISTRIFHGLSTAQTLVLLGWNALTSSQMRRAICYIGLAGAIVTDLKERISTTADPKASSRINGIDVFDVEKELIDHLYWTTYAICLWAFAQTGNQHFAPPLPAAQPSIFVPVSEDTSAVIRLDKISDNFNTLHAQAAAIRETWPLAHITSVIAYIFNFSPRGPDDIQWQSGLSVTPLPRLSKPLSSVGARVPYHEINRMLLQSVSHFNNQDVDSASHNLVLVVYHILLIHFLFPNQKEDEFGPDTFANYCSSTQEVLRNLSSWDEQQHGNYTDVGPFRTLRSYMFGFALDTCSRAFDLMLQQQTIITPANAGLLQSLAQHLHEESKSESLRQSSTLRMARKKLKAFLRSLSGGGGGGMQQMAHPEPHAAAEGRAVAMAVENSNPQVENQNTAGLASVFGVQLVPVAPLMTSMSPGQSSPASVSRTPDSDHLSQASTAALDGKVSASSPRDTAKMLSPTMVMPLTSMVQTGDGLISPGDVFKSSWQPMGPNELFDSTRTLDPSVVARSQEATAASATATTMGGSPSDAILAHSVTWLAQLSPGTMMDIDMAAGVPWDAWQNSNADASAGGSWDLGAATT